MNFSQQELEFTGAVEPGVLDPDFFRFINDCYFREGWDESGLPAKNRLRILICLFTNIIASFVLFLKREFFLITLLTATAIYTATF